MSRKEARKARRERRRELRRGALRQKMRTEPGAFWTYVVLRTIVILILIRSVMRADFESAIVCAFVLFIYVLPQFVEDRLDIEIPSVLEIVIFVFVFAAEILGELDSYFIRYQHWDTMLRPLRGGGLFAGQPAQPQREREGTALARLPGADGLLLFHDHRRALGVL